MKKPIQDPEKVLYSCIKMNQDLVFVNLMHSFQFLKRWQDMDISEQIRLIREDIAKEEEDVKDFPDKTLEDDLVTLTMNEVFRFRLAQLLRGEDDLERVGHFVWRLWDIVEPIQRVKEDPEAQRREVTRQLELIQDSDQQEFDRPISDCLRKYLLRLSVSYVSRMAMRPRRKSPRRKSPRRKSPRRKSPRRKSPRRKSPRRS